MEVWQFYKDKEIIVIDWPPYSPDLNPMRMYGHLLKKVRIKNIKKNQLNSNIIAILEEISDDQIKKYCTSIYDRIGDLSKTMAK